LAFRNFAELDAIQKAYQTKFNKPLKDAIHGETSGNFRHVLEGLLRPPRHYDAEILFWAMDGIGTNEKTLYQFLTARHRHEIQEIKQIYQSEHGKSLEDRIHSETSGNLRKLLIELLKGREPTDAIVNMEAAYTDSNALYHAGEGKIGTDEAKFIEIFSHRSIPHLRAVFAHYEQNFKHHTIEKAVIGEFSGDIEHALRTIIVFVRNPAEMWADALYDTMKGAGTDDRRLIHIIVANRDFLPEIKKAFSAKHNRTLYKAVESETSGDYKRSLLAIIKN